MSVQPGESVPTEAVPTESVPTDFVSTEAVLTDSEKTVLEIEGLRFRLAGRKEVLIAERLGIPATRYYQVLNRLLDDPAALAHAPATVSRLRRLRHQRARLTVQGEPS